MATRPWVTPQEVMEYSDRPNVQARTEARLRVDITRAEQYVISYTNNTFSDPEKYAAIPEPIKTAVILLAEAYAHNAVESAKTMKSETFDDYSYTAADSTTVRIDDLDLGALLEDYVVVKPKSGVTMKLRKL